MEKLVRSELFLPRIINFFFFKLPPVKAMPIMMQYLISFSREKKVDIIEE